jgi:hypothetical protein
MNRPLFLGLTVGGLALLVQQAAAHHGWGGQIRENFELSGTVQTGVSLAGPHATMQIRDESGQIWDLTLAPPSRTQRAGLSEEAIPVGAEVSIVGNRNASMDRYEVKTMRVTYAGKNYDVYADRL